MTLRPLTWIVSFLLVSVIWHHVAVPAIGQLHALLMLFLIRALDCILGLAVWSWLMGLLLGEKGQKLVFAFWLGLIKAVFQIVKSMGNITVSLLRKLCGITRK